MTESDQLWSDHILRNVADVCFHLTWKGPNVCREKQNNPPVTSKMGSCLWCCCHWPEPEINRIQKGSKRVVPAWKNRFFLLSWFIFLNVETWDVFFVFVLLFFFFWHWDVFGFCWGVFFNGSFFCWGGFLNRRGENFFVEDVEGDFTSKGWNIVLWGCWEGFYIEGFFSHEGDVTCFTLRLFTLWSLCGGKLFFVKGWFLFDWRFFLLRGDLLNWEENIFCWARKDYWNRGWTYVFWR